MPSIAAAARSWFDRLGGTYVLLLGGTFLLCISIAGWDAAMASLERDIGLILYLVPVFGFAVIVGGILRVLLPDAVVARWLGAESGLRGIVVATLVGMVMPGGPMVAFPLAIALYRAGADAGAMIAFITSWGMLAIQRMIIWDVPLLGLEIAGLRFLVSLPLPVIAGLIARQLAPLFDLRELPEQLRESPCGTAGTDGRPGE